MRRNYTIRIFSDNQILNLEKKNQLVAKIFENVCMILRHHHQFFFRFNLDNIDEG